MMVGHAEIFYLNSAMKSLFCVKITIDNYIQDIYNSCMQTQTLNIALPKELIKEVDERAKKEYRNRSELIREALRSYLTRKQEWEDLLNYGKKVGKKMGIKSEEDVNKIVYEFRHGKKSS